MMKIIQKIGAKRIAVVLVLFVVAFLSINVFSKAASNPENHTKTIESLDEKKADVLKLTAASAAASAAIAAIPGDATTPVANKLADLTSYFMIILMVVFLEKYLVTLTGYAAFTILIPAACILLGIGICLNRTFFKMLAIKMAAFALVIFIAAYMSDHHDKVKTLKGLLPVLIVGGITCLLIMLEPSMSVTMCIAFVTLFMLIIGGMSKKHTLMFSIPAGAIVPLLIILEPYRLKRLLAFIDPWASPQGEGFQLIQSLYSLGDGGWFGVGLFNSRQKYLFLPFAESDFILSIIGEEIGFIGLIALMSVFLFLIIKLIKIALSAKDRFGSMLASGVAFIIGVQTLLNIAVVTGSIPPTGLPLPFISSGGTSVMVFMAGIGICLNILKQSKGEDVKVVNFDKFKKSLAKIEKKKKIN